jgi:hypothetical protein
LDTRRLFLERKASIILHSLYRYSIGSFAIVPRFKVEKRCFVSNTISGLSAHDCYGCDQSDYLIMDGQQGSSQLDKRDGIQSYFTCVALIAKLACPFAFSQICPAFPMVRNQAPQLP